jgi:hypothetical protein
MTNLGENTATEADLPRPDYDPIFTWKRPGGRRFRLGIFLCAALTLHAFLFYLFQVVYPPSRRLVHQPAGITILSTTDPASKALLNKVVEATPAFEGGIDESAAILAAKENFVADYVASYRDYRPQLLRPNSKFLPKPLPMLATPGSITLPAIERDTPPAESLRDTHAVQHTASFVIEDDTPDGSSPGLQWAFAAPPPALKDSVTKQLASLASLPRLRLAVDARGTVRFVAMIDLLAQDLEQPLRTAASQLRFNRIAPPPANSDPTATPPPQPTSRIGLTFIPVSIAWTATEATTD